MGCALASYFNSKSSASGDRGTFSSSLVVLRLDRVRTRDQEPKGFRKSESKLKSKELQLWQLSLKVNIMNSVVMSSVFYD